MSMIIIDITIVNALDLAGISMVCNYGVLPNNYLIIATIVMYKVEALP